MHDPRSASAPADTDEDPCRPELDALATALLSKEVIAPDNALPLCSSASSLDDDERGASGAVIMEALTFAEQFALRDIDTNDLSETQVQALHDLNEDLGLDAWVGTVAQGGSQGSIDLLGKMKHLPHLRIGRDLGQLLGGALGKVGRPVVGTDSVPDCWGRWPPRIRAVDAVVEMGCCFRIGYGSRRVPCCLTFVACDQHFFQSLNWPRTGGAAGRAPQCPNTPEEAYRMIIASRAREAVRGSKPKAFFGLLGKHSAGAPGVVDQKQEVTSL